MNPDISHILKAWPYDASANVRKIVGADGSGKLQVRLPLGIEQYELEGRPDGIRPEGAESYLHLFEEQLAQRAAADEPADDFTLTREDCGKLREESMQYYFRYLLCFQIGEFDLVVRDTERNMRAFRFVDAHADHDDDRNALNQYWPYIIRINGMARALASTERGELAGALLIVRKALEKVKALDDVPTQTFLLEKMRSVAVLEEMVEEIEGKAPPNEAEIVKERLEKAVAAENYERAAQLRDILRNMGKR